jgi:hypothetical protein
VLAVGEGPVAVPEGRHLDADDDHNLAVHFSTNFPCADHLKCKDARRNGADFSMPVAWIELGVVGADEST